MNSDYQSRLGYYNFLFFFGGGGKNGGRVIWILIIIILLITDHQRLELAALSYLFFGKSKNVPSCRFKFVSQFTNYVYKIYFLYFLRIIIG